MKNLRRFGWYQLPAIIWAIAIFVQSYIPDFSTPPLGISFQDKLAHAIVFGFLGYLITRSFYYNSNDTLRKYAILLGIIIGLLYGISDEIHQSFVHGRYAEVSDVIADFIGIILAQFFFIYKKYSPERWYSKWQSPKNYK